jgi:nucleotide-binding universal stress UspA family protein
MVSYIKKILVPMDGSKKSFEALDRAINLATLTNAKLTVLNVIPHIGEGGPRTKAFDQQTIHQGKAVVHNAQKIAKKKGVKISTKILRGWPGIETVKLAKSGKFDHIILSTTGTGSTKGDVLGSVSNYVIHKAKIPVYLIK